jgi:hypothetical protein
MEYPLAGCLIGDSANLIDAAERAVLQNAVEAEPLVHENIAVRGGGLSSVNFYPISTRTARVRGPSGGAPGNRVARHLGNVKHDRVQMLKLCLEPVGEFQLWH